MLRLSSPLQLQQVWERPKASPPPSSPVRYADEQDDQEEAETKQYASSIESNAVSETHCSVVGSIEIPIPPPRPAPMVPPKDPQYRQSTRLASHSSSSSSAITTNSSRSVDTQQGEQRQNSVVPPVMHDSSSADGTVSFCSSSNMPPTPTSAMHSKSKDCLSSGIPPPPPIPNMESTISSREDGGSLRRAASRLSLKRRGFSKKIKKVLSFQKKRKSTVF